MYLGRKIQHNYTRIVAQIRVLVIAVLIGYSDTSSAVFTHIQDAKRCPSSYGLCWEVTGLITQSDLRELARAVDIMSKTKATPFFLLRLI